MLFAMILILASCFAKEIVLSIFDLAFAVAVVQVNLLAGHKVLANIFGKPSM